MTRKLKALGLALMATFALGAVAASGAAAAEFHSEVEPTVLTGTDSFHSDHTFTLPGGITLSCTESNLAGTVATKTATSIKLFPTFTGCSDNVGHADGTVTVDSTGCWYELHSHTNATSHLPVTIKCTEGTKGIVITDTSCTLTVTPQTAQEGIQATNLGTAEGRDVTFHATAKVTVDKGTEAGCFLLGTTATYTGTGTLRGFKDNGTTGDFDNHPVYTEGAQVGIWWE